MKIIHICAEMYPLLKTGGLADVMGALPLAQAKTDEVRMVLPAFPPIVRNIGEIRPLLTTHSFLGEVLIHYAEYKGIFIYLVDAPCYHREGNPYHDEQYRDYGDNFERFALLGFIGAELATGLDPQFHADVIHAHDWHAGLSMAYLQQKHSHIKKIFTIHNLAYQGCFNGKDMHHIWLDPRFYHPEGLEFHQQISFLKAGIVYSDVVTTVSPSYAKEITSSEYGYGLSGLLSQKAAQGRLQGILNGVGDDWNPRTDRSISYHFHAQYLQGKSKNKKALLNELRLSDQTRPLFVMVSRLTEQKGIDLVIENARYMVEHGANLAILGSGDPKYEAQLSELAAQIPEHLSLTLGYNEALSHQLIAAADAILVPSRFEPCGLTQLYGLKYGTLPIVHHTGGLADTVVDGTTGFVFANADVLGLRWAIDQALNCYQKPRIYSKIRKQAMAEDFSWEKVADAYRSLYLS